MNTIRTTAQEKTAKTAFAKICSKSDLRIKKLISTSDSWMKRVLLNVEGDKVFFSAAFYGHTYEYYDKIEKLFRGE